MLIKVKRKLRHPDAPQRHEFHSRPMTRRELIGQGFIGGSASVLGGGALGLFSNPRQAYATLADDLAALIAERERARKERNWARADEIRNRFAELGYMLEDTPEGTVWKRS